VQKFELWRYFYGSPVETFLISTDAEILGTLAANNTFALDVSQRDAWLAEIHILKATLQALNEPGHIYLEFTIPRVGKRVDAIAIFGPVVFVIEFKIGETAYAADAVDQAWDYALDLKNFHESSHDIFLVPIVVATEVPDSHLKVTAPLQGDHVSQPLTCNARRLKEAISTALCCTKGPDVDSTRWQEGRYLPTPTIIEAASALYRGHSVVEISRSDAGATNLTTTTAAIEEIISRAQSRSEKAICFITGVPGAGKTLVGLDVATRHRDKAESHHSVFLSGNGPLVSILREALARDRVRHEASCGRKVKKGNALSEVKAFIQNVHHFRDECLVDAARPPAEHVAIFDEAQRAWNREQTSNFMRRKKNKPDFDQSEPEFLISCLDRHPDWAVVVCLVGGGQEINTGEAGISEWIDSILRSFPHWQLFISSRLNDSEYAAGKAIEEVQRHRNVTFRDELHLAVSMRSFRAENVSSFVKHLLDLDRDQAHGAYRGFAANFPLAVTRSLNAAKRWLRTHARGSERYGIIVSSEAQRLKPHAIDVRSEVDPIHWFLDGKEDVRSSYYLEDVVTEFQVQGLELDWTCVTWDADFRFTDMGWEHWSFCGDRWNRIRKLERQAYLKNAYRVLLTRARQGMVIVVPEGDAADPTRKSEYYDPTFEYLRALGVNVI